MAVAKFLLFEGEVYLPPLINGIVKHSQKTLFFGV